MSSLLSSCTLLLQAVLGSSVLFLLHTRYLLFLQGILLPLSGIWSSEKQSCRRVTVPRPSQPAKLQSVCTHMYTCTCVGVSLAHYFFLYFYILKNTRSFQYPQFQSCALRVSPLVVNSLFNSDHPSAGCPRQQALPFQAAAGAVTLLLVTVHSVLPVVTTFLLMPIGVFPSSLLVTVCPGAFLYLCHLCFCILLHVLVESSCLKSDCLFCVTCFSVDFSLHTP